MHRQIICMCCGKEKTVTLNQGSRLCGTCRRKLYDLRKQIWQDKTWLKMVEWCNGFCLGCDKPCTEFTIDHITPLSIDWSYELINLQPLCHDCNNRKGDRVIDYRPHYWLVNLGLVPH